MHKPASSAAASARLTIDLAALAANYALLRQQVAADCRVAGVVKADAYGLGLEPVVSVLERAGCPHYFVATFDEALRLRALTAKPVAVLGGLMGPADDYARHDILPVLNSLPEIELWRDNAHKTGRAHDAIIHCDTGMSRLGLDTDDAAALAVDKDKYLVGLNLALLMTHMACADEKANPMTATQYRKLRGVADHFPGVPLSAANSSAIFRDSTYHGALVRPGMALYGLNPTPETANPMRPVAGIEVRVLQVRTARPGDTIGYGTSVTVTENRRLAIVALGYADGLPRQGSNKVLFYWHGKPCPVVGRISMDTIIVDVTAANPAPRPGDWLELIGPHQSADTLAESCGTIGYEILTSLGARYQRLYNNPA